MNSSKATTVNDITELLFTTVNDSMDDISNETTVSGFALSDTVLLSSTIVIEDLGNHVQTVHPNSGVYILSIVVAAKDSYHDGGCKYTLLPGVYIALFPQSFV